MKTAITFFMRAYNAEKYIQKGIESILNQSMSNLELILVNNASTDSTGEICKRYAAKDKRILYVENKKNTYFHPEIEEKWIHPKGEFFSILDADDYYSTNFARTMYDAATKQKADIAICGTTMFLDHNPRQKADRIPPALSTDQMKELGPVFTNLYGSLRPLWAKIFRTDFYERYSPFAFDRPDFVVSASDTYGILRFMMKCRSFVSVNKALHHYRVHENSFYSSSISKNRVLESDSLFEQALDLLKQWNAANLKNMQFLYEVHRASISDCLQYTEHNVRAPTADRINVIQEVTNNDRYYIYGMSEGNQSASLNIIRSATETVLSQLSSSQEASVENFYIVRLFRAFQKKKAGCPASEYCALFLSALCDPDNRHLWGMAYMPESLNDMPLGVSVFMKLRPEGYPMLFHNPALIRDLANGDYESAIEAVAENETCRNESKTALEIVSKSIHILNEHRHLTTVDNLETMKENISKSISEGKMKEAEIILDFLQKQRILDRECLYFKIFVTWKHGDSQLAVETAAVAAIFWNDDPDMMALCGDVFAAVGGTGNAVKAYSRAVELSGNSVFRADIQERMNGIRQ